MPDQFNAPLPPFAPTPERPLAGQTILLVEDSRFAAEAIRMFALRSGARVRRADSIAAARRHLATYRPTIAVIDEGLPDGSGTSLISDICGADDHAPTIIATSGSSEARDAMLSAGASAFVEKPVPGLAEFQSLVIDLLALDLPWQTRGTCTAGPLDPIALRDDLIHAAAILDAKPGPEDAAYLARFLHGLGRSSGDTQLIQAAEILSHQRFGDESAVCVRRMISGMMRTEGFARLAV